MADRGMSRRALLATVATASIALVATTAGQTWTWLEPFNVFAPRRRGDGPQGLPVNRTAAQAGVTDLARDPGWRLTVVHNGTETAFTRDELRAMPQAESVLPIACVEGWSTVAHWRGVRMADLLAAVGAPEGASVHISSLEASGPFHTSDMGPEFARDPLTLVALELNGEELDVEHGYPARIIAPARPGVRQTKWIERIEVRA
ncbi:molybdopterin-dependent oxidoreductase [Agromyces sp. SYSU T00194]|uniref:molybdopterin-dependent oxidoreductase n=1 Tax=Agromyces chitinivorans TaxID=3158560 RepID=UPI003390BE12